MLPRGYKTGVAGVSGLRSQGLLREAGDLVRECRRQVGDDWAVTDIVVYVGTNDGGDLGIFDVEEVSRNLDRVQELLKKQFGDVKIWWSEILPRPRCPQEFQREMSVRSSQLGQSLRNQGWEWIRHPAFYLKGAAKADYFWDDGLHLDQGLGLQYFARELAEGIQRLHGDQ